MVVEREKAMRTHISHSWTYADHDVETDAQLREAIRRQMAPCGVVLIPAGVYASYSKWIDMEIKLAEGFQQRKPIIAIEPWGSQRTSARVKQAADRIVKWNTESVVKAIKELP